MYRISDDIREELVRSFDVTSSYGRGSLPQYSEQDSYVSGPLSFLAHLLFTFRRIGDGVLRNVASSEQNTH